MAKAPCATHGDVHPKLALRESVCVDEAVALVAGVLGISRHLLQR